MNRKVSALIWSRNEKKHTLVIGIFHCWGITYEEFGVGPGMRTIAIIEKEDGTVVTANPEDVKFLKGK